MDSDQILRISSLAGRIILENGGEISRVEDTMLRICRSFGMRASQSFAMPTGIMISITDPDGRVHTSVERITARRINLEKVELVNSLSRRIESGCPDPDEVEQELSVIRARSGGRRWLQILYSALGAGAFTVLFGGGVPECLAALVIGVAIRVIQLLLGRVRLNDFFVNMLGGASATVFGWISSFLGADMDIVIISSLMLLVPGLIMTNAVRDVAAGDLVSGSSLLMEALFVAVAIASGSAIAFQVIQVLAQVVI